MHFEVDYTEYCKIEATEEVYMDKKARDRMDKGLAEILDFIHSYNAQFIEQYSPGKKEKIIWFYLQLTEIAFVNEGRVTLDIDEGERTATLKYMGKNLSKTCEENDKTGMTFAALFYVYDFVSIDHEKEQFVITIYEELYDKVMIHDTF